MGFPSAAQPGLVNMNSVHRVYNFKDGFYWRVQQLLFQWYTAWYKARQGGGWSRVKTLVTSKVKFVIKRTLI